MILENIASSFPLAVRDGEIVSLETLETRCTLVQIWEFAKVARVALNLIREAVAKDEAWDPTPSIETLNLHYERLGSRWYHRLFCRVIGLHSTMRKIQDGCTKQNGCQPPTVHWDNDFEKKRPGYIHSAIFHVGEPPKDAAQDRVAVAYINGVDTSLMVAVTHAKYIQSCAQTSVVYGVYNATHGKKADFYECILGMNYTATKPAKLLHHLWDQLLAQTPSRMILQVCHSQGAIHVRNALLSYDREKRTQISVLGVAPAAYMWPGTCRAARYIATTRDFIPFLDWSGKQRAQAAIVHVPSDADAKRLDHGLLSSSITIPLDTTLTRLVQSLTKEEPS